MSELLATATALILPLLSCHALPPEIKPAPDWLESATFYQLYPQSFMDSDGNGIGDLKGIIGKLHYIKELGCDAVWMNPCFESAFMDAGYDVIDYCRVDPRYGTNEDLETLFKEANDRGIRICLDLVAGHTSDKHEWFLKYRKNESPYSDRYIWTNDANSKDDGYVFDGTERHEYFMKNIFDCLPAINYGFAKLENPWEQSVDSPAARTSREELFRIMDFWMSRGAAGFRVDMAASLIKRPRSGVRNTEEQLKVVMAFLLTLKGIPFIYYGDEIGMRIVDDLPNMEGSSLSAMKDLYGHPLGNRAGTRTPMQWTRGPNAGFSNAPASLLYLPVDPQATDNNVEEQLLNSDSLFNFTKTLITLRKENKALGNHGEINFIYVMENTYPLLYIRKSGDVEFLVVINPSGKNTTAEIAINGFDSLQSVLKQGTSASLRNENLAINADRFSYGIHRITASKGK